MAKSKRTKRVNKKRKMTRRGGTKPRAASPTSSMPSSSMPSSSPKANFKQALMHLNDAQLQNAHVHDSAVENSFDSIVQNHIHLLPQNSMVDAINEFNAFKHLNESTKLTLIALVNEAYDHKNKRSPFYCCKTFFETICRAGLQEYQHAEFDEKCRKQANKELESLKKNQ